MKLYGPDNPHPRGMIGEITANVLLEAGWHEEKREGSRGLVDDVWVKGDVVTTLEWAWEIEHDAAVKRAVEEIEAL